MKKNSLNVTSSDPLLSIIIPTLNSASTLGKCLDSLVGQTYQNFEVLIMDGVSEDDTTTIATEYKVDLKELNVFVEPDSGIYDAMNKGINRAKGEWLYFLGSDDYLFETTTFEKFSRLPGLESLDVVYGNVISTAFGGSYNGKFNYSKLAILNICHQAVFMKKDVFSRIGSFNLNYKVHADWAHNISWFFSKEIKYTYIDQIIANFGEGGYSTGNLDVEFQKDKHLLLLKKGFGKLPPCELARFTTQAIKDREHSLLKLSQLLLLKIYLIFICKISRFKMSFPKFHFSF